MSGIFGIVDSDHQIQVGVIADSMARTMSHREWFVADHFVDKERNLAIGRIGIGIFNNGPQPLWNADETIALVMAGEFYNQETLPVKNIHQTDEQIALALYEQHGVNFVNQLNGVFIIALWDKKQNQIFIVNDRFGLYPLFYALRSRRFIFAPEMKGVLCDASFPKNLDLTALTQYMRFQNLLGERTFFEDILLLPPASMLIFNLTTVTLDIQSYWTFDDIPYRPEIRFDDAVNEAGRLLRKAVQRQPGDKYRIGVYLSGGLDSRILLGLTNHRPVTSLTYGVHNCRDVQYAKRIAKTVGSHHHWFDLSDGQWVKENVDFHLELTEGFHSWIHAHGISTLPQARKLFDINLTGWDGGTIMGHKDSVESLQISAVDDAAFTSRLFFMFNQKYTWPSVTEAEEMFLYSSPLNQRLLGLAFESFRTVLSHYLNYRSDVRGEYFYIRNLNG
jgi:asparagine synthase (glutamine-hydrolysing)